MTAGRKSSYERYFEQSSTEGKSNNDELSEEEFDESDVWGVVNPIDLTDSVRSRSKPIPSSRPSNNNNNRRKSDLNLSKGNHKAAAAAAAASLPLNIPDWSKILKDEYYNNNNGYGYSGRYDNGDVDDEDDVVTGGGVVTPPHEYLWRNRAASFSVHEGVGRTLKGRDLRRVRNAIFEKMGFQD